MHITPSGKAVLKAEKTPKIGEVVLDENRKRVGTVLDIFGSTSSPYIGVLMKTKNPHSTVNKFLYVPVSPKRKKRSKKKK
jgi:rRNA processing protein Gar1